MAFPSVSASTTNRTTASNTSTHTISLPSGVQNGDFLLVIFSTDGAPTISINTGSSGTGWEILRQNAYSTTCKAALIWKIADGNDALVLTTSVNEQSSHASYRIAGANRIFSNVATGSSTNSNPPSLGPGIGAKDFLWIATRSGDSTVVASAAPTNYGSLLTQAAAGTGGASTNAAHRTNNASSEDPGTFTSTTEQWVAFTIGLYFEPIASAAGTSDGTSTATATGQAVIETFSDNFNDGSIDSRWIEQDLIGNATYNESGGKLTISTPSGADYDNTGEAKLWQNCGNVDLVIAAKLTHDWTSATHWQQSGIIVAEDNNNYIVLKYQKYSSSAYRLIWGYVASGGWQFIDTGLTSGSSDITPLWVKLTRVGDLWRAYYSTNGTDWTQSTYNSGNGFTRSITVSKIGLTAGSYEQVAVDAVFDWFSDDGNEPVASGDVQGSSAGSSSASGILKGKGEVAGTSAGTSTAQAIPKGFNFGIGTSAGTTTITGVVKGLGKVISVPVSGVATATATAKLSAEVVGQLVEGLSSVTGVLKGIALLQGTSGGIATTSATASGFKEAHGTSDGIATTSGTLVGSAQLQGTSDGIATVVATVKVNVRVFGTVNGLSTAVSTLKGNAYLLGLTEGTSFLSGTLLGKSFVLASSQGSSTTLATAKGLGLVLCSAPGVATATATIKATGKAVGQFIVGLADASATLKGLATVQGTSAGTSTAEIYYAGDTVRGISNGISTTSAILKGLGSVSSSVTGQATAQAKISGKISIAASVSGSSTVLATVKGTGKIVSLVQGTSVTSAILKGVILGQVTITGQSVAEAIGLRSALVRGTVAGVATAQAILKGSAQASGTSECTSDAIARSSSDTGLEGSIFGTSEVSGTLKGFILASGSALAQSSVQGILSITIKAGGTSTGSSSIEATLKGSGNLQGISEASSLVEGFAIGRAQGNIIGSSHGSSIVSGVALGKALLSGVSGGSAVTEADLKGHGRLQGSIYGRSWAGKRFPYIGQDITIGEKIIRVANTELDSGVSVINIPIENSVNEVEEAIKITQSINEIRIVPKLI